MRLKTKFQDWDCELGEVVKAKVTTYYDENKVVVMADRARGGVSRFEYNSIKDFTDHWEDAPEEPKKYWYVSDNGCIYITTDNGDGWDEYRKEIGNYFLSKEKAEKAEKRWRAWTRLENKGLKIRLRSLGGYSCLEANWGVLEGDYSDVRLLFGGEE